MKSNTPRLFRPQGMGTRLALSWLAASLLVSAAPVRKVSYEPLADPAAASRANLFLDARVTASGHWDSQTPDRAVNGNRDVSDHWACENLPVWHQVDLAEPTSLSVVHVWPYWADGRIYQFKVEGSIDGKEWKLLGDMTGNSIAATAEGVRFRFDPVEVRHLRTTFLDNSRGAENGGHLVEIEGYAEEPAGGLGGGIGTTDLRYPPEGEIGGLRPFAGGIELTAWRGERVSAQVVLQSERSQENVCFGPSELSSGDQRIEIAPRFVRYTLADGVPQGDILDSASSLPLPAGRNRPVWIAIDVPADVPAGEYRGSLVVVSDSDRLEVPVRLRVLAAVLPPPDRWAFHLDLWQHPQAVARWHDVEPWSDLHLALLEPSMKRLADAGQKTITCSIIEEPWNGQTYDHFPSMIEWRKKADGSWSYDYSIFDRWVGFMSERCGLGEARIHCYSMLPWSLKFRYFDEAERRHVDLALQPGTPAFDEFWGSFLEDFTRHLKEKGWLERTRIAVDERPDAQMRGALATLAKHAPGLRVASAINHPSELLKDVDDMSPIINHTDRFPRELLDERRVAGHKTTFYVCTHPPRPNTFTFSPPAESEWLPLFSAANGFDGFLRWAYHSWVENPLVSTDFTSWPSGDCFLVYPGDRSSVRFERLRDGIETFEKIRLLRAHAAKSANLELKASLAKLDAELANFTWARGSQPGGHAEDVRRVNEIVLESLSEK
ncbi:glycoside hydrolase domain-containing protein [Haloferula sp. A504]|uniref:glycoside hydrolase domain-containing protein n=1 Tax=Haloferula sp. A504 TaxID=3373601 RepID=UPI0031BFBAA5|nr:DUF4091 domain-containing protein [Verrucomicrobiaceae bacterium E54]